jgi:hypothetical protein
MSDALLIRPSASALTVEARRRCLAGAEEVLECRRVLRRGDLNVVGEVLRGEGEFVEFDHYPNDDVADPDSHAQYYYHAHRNADEHGHFHTFIRAGGMPRELQTHPDYPPLPDWPAGDDRIAHLIAISMDAYGEPKALFATNRWVTDESWFPASDVKALIDRFVIDHANPSWPTNRWIGAMLKLFRPHIDYLLDHRDQTIASWQARLPGETVLENRDLEITGLLPINVDDWIAQLRAA